MVNMVSKFLKNLGSKLLIILIALSFAIWGIGDIFTPNNNNPTIAKVGNSKIKLNEFQLDYQLIIDRIRQTSQEPITEDFLKALGIHRNVLDGLISKKYINLLSKNLDINIADNYVKKAIINNPIFYDQLGVFNKDYFDYYLNRNNLKEKDIYNITKDALSNDLLIQSISYSEFLPDSVSKSILNKRDIARKSEIYIVDTSSMIMPDKNYTNETILKKYNAVKNNFLIPETRNIKIITFNYSTYEGDEKVTNKELKKFYEENIQIYENEETRNMYMAQFKEEKEIKKFLEFFNKDKNFFNALKQFKISKEKSFFEKLTYSDLDPRSSDMIFNLQEGEVSEILKTSFGYKIFYLEKINKKTIRSFEDSKNSITQDLLKEKTNEKIYNQANVFYEKFLQSRNFSQSLDALQTKVIEINKLGLNDIERNDQLKKLKLNNTELSKVIFNLKTNDISEIIEDEYNNLHYIYLDSINSSTVKSLKAVETDVINMLYNEERKKKAKNIADEFKEEYANKSYDNKKSIDYVSFERSDWLTIDNRLGNSISSLIKKQIFNTKLNNLSEPLPLPGAKYFLVRPIEQSFSIITEKNKSNLKSISSEINASLESDINNAILYDLSKLYKSNINEKFIESF